MDFFGPLFSVFGGFVGIPTAFVGGGLLGFYAGSWYVRRHVNPYG